MQEGVDWLQGISYVILLLYFHSVKLFHFVRFFFIISFVFFLSTSAVRSNYTVSTDALSHICCSFTSLTYTKDHVSFSDKSVFYEILMHTLANSVTLYCKQ